MIPQKESWSTPQGGNYSRRLDWSSGAAVRHRLTSSSGSSEAFTAGRIAMPQVSTTTASTTPQELNSIALRRAARWGSLVTMFQNSIIDSSAIRLRLDQQKHSAIRSGFPRQLNERLQNLYCFSGVPIFTYPLVASGMSVLRR